MLFDALFDIIRITRIIQISQEFCYMTIKSEKFQVRQNGKKELRTGKHQISISSCVRETVPICLIYKSIDGRVVKVRHFPTFVDGGHSEKV